MNVIREKEDNDLLVVGHTSLREKKIIPKGKGTKYCVVDAVEVRSGDIRRNYSVSEGISQNLLWLADTAVE